MTINTLIKNQSYLLILAYLFLGMAGFIHSKFEPPPLIIQKQDSALNISNEIFSFFSIGQNRLLADLLWVTTLLESDLEHYKEKDLNSWMFIRFKSIIELDKNFLQAYQFGGKYLSIVKDDLIGAREIFEKGLSNFPKDYDLLFNYAFLLAFELGDYNEAINIYKKVQEFSQAPLFIKSLIPKMQYMAKNDLITIYPIVLSLYLSEPKDSPLNQKLYKDVYAIKAEIDLNCLNKGEADCQTKDYDGNFYIKKGADFIAPKSFQKYKLFFKN